MPTTTLVSTSRAARSGGRALGGRSPGATSATGTIPCSMSAAVSPELDALSATTCVVTGGLGFIGSNMVHALASAGARVRVVDALVPEHGGDRRNLDGLEHPERVDVLIADLGDAGVAEVLSEADVVFNVAGQVSHLASMTDPLRDLDLNVRSQLAF